LDIPLQLLYALKAFFIDKPEFAFLTLSVLANVYLYKQNQRLHEARFGVLLEWLPVISALERMLGAAAVKARKDQSKPRRSTKLLGDKHD
jgi:hypothetical protein